MSITNQINEVIDLLFAALENRDWSCVSEAYFLLTGQEKEVSNQPNILEQNTNEMFSVLMNRIDKLEQKKSTTKGKNKKTNTDEQVKKNEDFSVESKRSSRKIADRRRENKFEQMSDAIAEAEQEKGFDKINDDIKPTQRSRQQYSSKKVKCVECNSINDVHPMFAKEFYTCDKCIQKRGR